MTSAASLDGFLLSIPLENRMCSVALKETQSMHRVLAVMESLTSASLVLIVQ